MTNLIEQANNNIKYYIFVRIFAKRVFLPITAIYFIDTANFTISDIGFLSAFFSIIQLFAEVPTGYFADRVGRMVSLRVGATLAGLATLIYIFIHSKTGVYLGVVFEALAYSFMGGAGEAMIHDSLEVKGQIEKYSQVMSHNMAISLVVNAILITLVPMTYSIDPRLPFAFGTVAYLLLLLAALKLRDIYPPKPRANNITLPDFSFLRNHKSMLLFGLSFGIISALYTSPNDMLNVSLKEFGLSPDKLGIVYGLGSIFGALVGRFAHLLRQLKVKYYTTIDSFILLLLYLVVQAKSYLVISVVIIMSISFWRYRRIIYQDYLLRIYPNSYKATLVSTLNNLEQLNSIWLPIVLTQIISNSSITRGFWFMTLGTLCIIPIFLFSSHRFLGKRLGE